MNPLHGSDAIDGMGCAHASDERVAQLREALVAVRARIAGACAAVGRAPDEVTLVAVTKGFPAADVALLARLGVRDVGEARDQEAKAKVAEVARLCGASLRWHVIGRLQTNKARSVAGYASLVHTVDRPELARALGKAAATAERVERAGSAGDAPGRPLEVLAQVSLDGDPSRGGAAEPDLPALLEAIAAQPALGLRGLMTVAPRAGSPAEHFAEAHRLLEAARGWAGPLDVLSAGMSGDFEDAIAHGATHVRVGTALLGDRAPLLG
jgi:pyridoxal phosphate enzyme (YggS family)